MKIGIYELVRELGCGGMAQVWLAHRVWPDGKRRPCVVKLPRRSAVANESMLRQFLEEARLSILLSHANIVTVFDAGVHEGLPYLVMEYIPGKDLSQLLRASIRVGARWDVETAIHVIREVGQGLLFAHTYEQPDGVSLQIVHRDVASKNVMIDGTGSVRLMDFGVATSLSTMTSRIHVKGTLPYMAPEHYLGQANAASDVFGLGGIFWEMLAGRRFRAELEGQELIAKVVEGAVEPVGRELPLVIQRILDGMLHPSAAERITLPEVLQALEKFPYRRSSLREMMSVYFGRAGRRTGLSQIHFAASKELVDTIAVAKAAGVSISEVRPRRLPCEPAPIPNGFRPVEIPDTGRIDPLAVEDALDDDRDDEVPGAHASAGAAGDQDDEVATGLWTPPGTLDEPAPVAPGNVQPNASHCGSRVSAGTGTTVEPKASSTVSASAWQGSSTTEPSTGRDAGTGGIWAKSGDTLRDAESSEPAPARSEPTVRLSAEIVTASASALVHDAENKRPTDRLPPPAEASTPTAGVSYVASTSVSAVGSPALEVSASGSAQHGSYASHHSRPEVGTPPRGRTLVTTRRGSALAPLAATGAVLVVLALGLGTWFEWPITEAHSETEREPSADSMVAVGSPGGEGPSTEETEKPASEGTPAAMAKAAPAERRLGVEDIAEGPAGIASSSDEDGATTEDSSRVTDEDPPASGDPAEPDLEETAREPAAEPTEPTPKVEPRADEPSTATKHPQPKLELVVRRGLAVSFAEVRVGRGKVRQVPVHGAVTLRVRPDTYTLRYRTKPDGAWESIRHTFSPGMQYAGHLELNGLRIMAMPDKGR